MYQHPLLISFNQESIERLKQQSYEIQLDKGQPLFFQGDAATVVYYIKSGILKILKTSIQGQEKIFSIYSRGNLVALSVLFNDPHQYPASGVALEETVVVAIPIPELEKAILSNHQATRAWFCHLNRRLEGVQQLLTDQVFIDARDRFKKVIQLFMKHKSFQKDGMIVFEMPLTKQEMAELLSIRRETFSRLLSSLKEEGLCEYSKKQMRVNREWLES
ncbi:Crp/Fnr family transcriptional regulator [Turicibacter sanguinis]|uniref:Crp/Fnr family transcriptional regulator n=1 Tax=Turicibacter sanguinis TaxID=154288 RepID=UPI0039918808